VDNDLFLTRSFRTFIHRLHVLVIGVFFLLHLLKAVLAPDVGITKCRSLSVIRILFSILFVVL